MWGKQFLLVLAALCLPGTALAQTPSGAAAPINTEYRWSAGNACPLPEALARNELALGCSGDVTSFIERLRSEKACGSQTKYSVDQACAVIIYSLDPEFTGARDLPPIVTVRIGKISALGGGGVPAVTVVKHNGVAEQFAPDRVYELMLPIRVDARVRVHAKAGTGTRFDEKASLLQHGIRYYPALLVGRGEAASVMTPDSIKRHFTMPMQIVQDLTAMLSSDCMIRKRFC